MLRVGLRFRQWGGLGFLRLVFRLFLFDVRCWVLDFDVVGVVG